MMTPNLKENVKFYQFKRQSSFGIRKLTVGVASVSLGTALVATAPAASADTLEPASSVLAAPSTEVTNQTADKAALAQALSDAQAIDLSQQAPEVAEGFVELFARATALLDQVDAEQAELDALAQELQQAILALTTELPTAVGTPVEVVEADTELPAVSEEEVTEEATVAPEREAEVVLSTMPDILYPTSTSVTAYMHNSGGQIDILTPDGQAMPLDDGKLDAGDGKTISRKLRITVPEGASNQEIRINLGERLTFALDDLGQTIRYGYMTIDGQQSKELSLVSPSELVYRPKDGARTIDIPVMFRLKPGSTPVRALSLNSTPYYSDNRANGTLDGIVRTRPFAVTYGYTVNGKQFDLKAGINTLMFSATPSDSTTLDGMTIMTADKVQPSAPAILYPTSNYDYTNQSGARVEILTPDGQAMGLSEALDGGNGVTIRRKLRITVPEGATQQQIDVDLGDHLTYMVGTNVRALIAGVMKIDGQLAVGSDVRSNSSQSISYVPTDGGRVIEIDFSFNAESQVDNLRVLGLSSDADTTNTRLRQEAIAAGGFVETRPLLVTYRYTLNGKQSELNAGINTLHFPTPLTFSGQKITSVSESSYMDLVAKTMRKAMAEGTLPIALYDTDMTDPNGSKTLFTIDAKVGTVIDEAWSPSVFVPIPRIPGVLPTTPDGTIYDVGSLGLSDLAGKMLSEDIGLTAEVLDYLLKRMVQLDEVYLSGVNKKLADYGLRMEVDTVSPSQLFNMGHRRAGIGNHLSEHYYGSLHISVPTYRLRGTLRLPEGTVGNVAQTTWKDLFHIPLFGGVSRDSYADDTFMHRLPGAKEDNNSEYSKLSYTLNYSDAMWEGPGVQSRSIRWGSTEFPLLTSVRVYDDSRPSQAEVYKPTAVLGGLTLGINDPIDPAQLIGNRADLPSDARFEFVEPVGDPLSGTSKIVSVRITFSDGSVKTVRSRLKFRATQAQESIPEIQSLRVSQGSSIRPIDFIKNASSLPVNTRYSWSQEPSTRVPGGRVGQILVTYPDGSTEIITVRFTVR